MLQITFNATRTDDPTPDGCSENDCSLREAVIDADATLEPDTIMLPAGTYLIDLDANTSLDNNGTLNGGAIEANGDSLRLFTVTFSAAGGQL